MRMPRVAMIMAAALAISGVASTQAVAPAISDVATTNTSWWRLALAAPAISPDFALVSKHVCERGSTFVSPQLKRYFPSDCSKRMTASWEFSGHRKKKEAKGLGRIRARRLAEERMIEAADDD